MSHDTTPELLQVIQSVSWTLETRPDRRDCSEAMYAGTSNSFTDTIVTPCHETLSNNVSIIIHFSQPILDTFIRVKPEPDAVVSLIMPINWSSLYTLTRYTFTVSLTSPRLLIIEDTVALILLKQLSTWSPQKNSPTSCSFVWYNWMIGNLAVDEEEHNGSVFPCRGWLDFMMW